MAGREYFDSPAGIPGIADTCSLNGPIPEWVFNSEVLALDIETDAGTDVLRNRVVVVALSNGIDAHIIDVREQAEQMYDLWEYLIYTDQVIIGHNIAFDLMFLRQNYGEEEISDQFPEGSRLWDTMVAEKVLCSNDPFISYGLEEVVDFYCGVSLDKSYQMSFDQDGLSLGQMEYAVSDVLLLPRIAAEQVKKLQNEDLMQTMFLEMVVLPVFAEMGQIGISIDEEVHADHMRTAQHVQDTIGQQLSDELTPHIMDVRIEKRDEQQVIVDQWNLEYETAVWDYRFAWWEWQFYQKYVDMHVDLMWDDFKWNDMTIDKKSGQPLGQRRYVRAMMSTGYPWRQQHPRPPKPKVDQNPINLNSDDQMLVALERWGIKLQDFKASTIGTALTQTENERVIEMLNWLVLYKKATKLLDAFGSSLVERIGPDGRLRASYQQIGTQTGRPSASRANLYQIPKRGKNKTFRKAFIPAEGYVFVRADYSQMELRLVADQSHDENMIQAFTTGVDLHTYTASLMFNVPMEKVSDDQRATAKTINFGILYGMGPTKLRSTLAVDGIRLSDKEAKDAVTLWKKTYPQAARWIERTGTHALSVGWTATPYGRKRFFPSPQELVERSKGKYDLRGAQFAIKREGANHPIQGGNADITKLALVLIYRMLPKDAHIVLTVYDEIVVECPEDTTEEVREIVYHGMMAASSAILKTVPSAVEAELTRSWSSDDRIVTDSLSKS